MTARRTSAGSHRTGRPSSHGLTLRVSPAAAAASRNTVASGWPWRKLAATAGVTGPSTALATTPALPSPNATITTRRADRIVPTPMVIARRGTYCSPKKSPAASRRVTRSSVISRVRLSRPLPGSLKPTCPVRPMPSSCRSSPPASRIRRS